MSVLHGGRMEAERVGWFERVMLGWRHVILVSEQTLVDNVAASVPWLAPVAPAYMVWHNAVIILGWPVWVAWVIALAVEGLGLSVVSTAFALWRDGRRSFWVAVATTLFYLFVVVTVNVALELGAPGWLAKALLSLLSVPAAVTIALRTQRAQDAAASVAEELKTAEVWREEQLRLEQLQREAEERAYARRVQDEERERAHELRLEKVRLKASGKFPKVSDDGGKVSEGFGDLGKVSVSVGGDWRKVLPEDRERIGKMSTQEVMAAFGVSERTATNWRKNARG